jgi:hypothetical protein
MNSRRQLSKKKRRNGKRKVYNVFPRDIQVNPIINRVLRFVGSSQNAIDITGKCLLNLLLSGISGSTAATNLVESIKINKISIYTTVDSTTDAFGGMSLNWKGERSPDKIINAQGTVSHPAVIHSRPPVNSLSAFWITNIDNNLDDPLFSIDSGGTFFPIVDLSLNFTLGTGATRTCTITNPALTGVGYSHLDNANTSGAVGGNTLSIVGLQQFTVTTP